MSSSIAVSGNQSIEESLHNSEGDCSQTTEITAISFNSHCLTDKSISDLDELEEALNNCPNVWIDVVGLESEERIIALLDLLNVDKSIFDLVLAPSSNAFYKSFGNSIFLSVQVIHDQRNISTSKLSILQIGKTVVTFRQGLCKSICEIRDAVRQQHGVMNGKSRLYVLQRLVECSIDSFQFVLDRMSIELEELEERVVKSPQSKTMTQVHSIRKELLVLKRILAPLKGELRQFARDANYKDEVEEIAASQEILQHASNMLDDVEYFISVTSDIMALHMSSVSNRMNEVMTVLAIVAAIFLPPSLIASIYGMNFYNYNSPWNMPEVNWEFGYPYALALMFGISILFAIYFWRRGWFSVFSK